MVMKTLDLLKEFRCYVQPLKAEGPVTQLSPQGESKDFTRLHHCGNLDNLPNAVPKLPITAPHSGTANSQSCL